MNKLIGFAITASLLTLASRAHAMGVYTDNSLVAWNQDGTAALILTTQSSSGTMGQSNHYALVTSTSKTPLVLSFDDTQNPDSRTQNVTAAACTKNVDTLTKALAAAKFKGVTLDAAKCKDAARGVVTISADATKAVTASEIPVPSGNRATTQREQTAKTLQAKAVGATPAEDTKVWAASDLMFVVLYGESGDDSLYKNGTVYVKSKTGYDVLVTL